MFKFYLQQVAHLEARFYHDVAQNSYYSVSLIRFFFFIFLPENTPCSKICRLVEFKVSKIFLPHYVEWNSRNKAGRNMILFHRDTYRITFFFFI